MRIFHSPYYPQIHTDSTKRSESLVPVQYGVSSIIKNPIKVFESYCFAQYCVYSLLYWFLTVMFYMTISARNFMLDLYGLVSHL